MKRSLLLLLVVAAVAALVWTQVPEAAKPAPTEPVTQPDNAPQTTGAQMTAADVEAFLEGIVPLQLERENIAGATVAVVKDGKVLFSKGYGYADREKKTPVSADETLFRPGSDITSRMTVRDRFLSTPCACRPPPSPRCPSPSGAFVTFPIRCGAPRCAACSGICSTNRPSDAPAPA